jgi:hypothetical protein
MLYHSTLRQSEGLLSSLTVVSVARSFGNATESVSAILAVGSKLKSRLRRSIPPS